MPLSIGLSLVAPDSFPCFGPEVAGWASSNPFPPCGLALAPLIGTLLIAVGEARFNMRNSIFAAFLMPTSFYFVAIGNTGLPLPADSLSNVALPLYVRAFHDRIARREYLAAGPALGGTGLMAVVVLSMTFLWEMCLPSPVRSS